MYMYSSGAGPEEGARAEREAAGEGRGRHRFTALICPKELLEKSLEPNNIYRERDIYIYIYIL